jgi:hypothetical protein
MTAMEVNAAGPVALNVNKAKFQCLLLGVKRTSRGQALMSANDPKRTWALHCRDTKAVTSLTTPASRQISAE